MVDKAPLATPPAPKVRVHHLTIQVHLDVLGQIDGRVMAMQTMQNPFVMVEADIPEIVMDWLRAEPRSLPV